MGIAIKVENVLKGRPISFFVVPNGYPPYLNSKKMAEIAFLWPSKWVSFKKNILIQFFTLLC